MVVQVTPAAADAWFLLHVATRTTNYWSDATWECTETRPPSWPDAYADEEVIWKPVLSLGAGDMLPRQATWKLQVNGWINAQSKQQLLRPWSTFQNRRAPAYLRKKIVIPPN